MLGVALAFCTLSMFVTARMFALVVQKNEHIQRLEAALKATRDRLSIYED